MEEPGRGIFGRRGMRECPSRGHDMQPTTATAQLKKARSQFGADDAAKTNALKVVLTKP